MANVDILNVEKPVKVDTNSQVLALGLGEDHMLVVTSTGVYCWGNNCTHQCAKNNTFTDKVLLENCHPLLSFDETIIAVAGSSYHSMALSGISGKHMLRISPFVGSHRRVRAH